MRQDDLKESAADVAALIPRYSWDLMDEDQRDALMANVVLPRWMQSTTDGVKLTPTWWGRVLGATPMAVKQRVYRLQASQKKAGKGAPSTPADQARIRHGKAVVRDPQKRKQLLGKLTPAELIDIRADVEDRLDDEIETKKAARRKKDKTTMGSVADEQGESPDDIRDSLTESWCDGMVLRVHNQAGKLARHVEKFGLVIHSFDSEEEQAYEEKHYLDLLNEAEKNIAEVRVALQERVQDRSRERMSA